MVSENTQFITDKGVKTFKDFNDGDSCSVLGKDGEYHKAVIRSCGIAPLQKVTFTKRGKTPMDVYTTKDQKWILDDGKRIANIMVGDKLCFPSEFFIQDLDWPSLTNTQKILWCKGYAFGRGELTIDHPNDVYADFWGMRMEYKDRFKIPGCEVYLDTEWKNQERHIGIVHGYKGEIPKFDSIKDEMIFINGIYIATGALTRKDNGIFKLWRIDNSDSVLIDYLFEHADSVGLYFSTATSTSHRSEAYTIRFQPYPQLRYTVKSIESQKEEENVYCFDESIHDFVLKGGIVIGN